MRVRKLGPGALSWASGSLEGGQTGDVPLEVVERYAHKLEVLEELPPLRPVVTDVAVPVVTDVDVKPKRVRKKKEP